VEIKDDLISRKDALSAIDGICATNERELAIKSLAHTMLLSKSMVPAINAEPVKHGRWLYKDRHRKSCRQYTGYDDMGEERTITVIEESEGKEPYCSECGAQAAESFMDYCPRCGARMDGGNAAHG